jgi:hypothetical protein
VLHDGRSLPRARLPLVGSSGALQARLAGQNLYAETQKRWCGCAAARRPVGARCAFSVQRAQPGFGGTPCGGQTATAALDSAPRGAAQRERSASGTTYCARLPIAMPALQLPARARGCRRRSGRSTEGMSSGSGRFAAVVRAS